MTTLFDGFYQMGYVARDIGRAIEIFARVHGVRNFRRKSAAPWMDAAHAWVGGTMIELIQPKSGAPQVYDGYVPEKPGAIRLHHHGFRVADAAAWDVIRRRVAEAGLTTPMHGTAMQGQLHYLYADTRALTGIYSEYVYLTGAALAIYDDVPHN